MKKRVDDFEVKKLGGQATSRDLISKTNLKNPSGVESRSGWKIFLLVFGIFLISFIAPLNLSLSDLFSNSLTVNLTSEGNFSHLNISDPDLVLYLPFDVNHTSSNITYDYTNNSNDGTATGGASYTSDGWIGGAYDFDGVNDYVNFNTISSITSSNNYTISFWVYSNNLTQTVKNIYEHTLGASDRSAISTLTGGVVSFGHYNGTGYYQRSGTIISGWHHIVAIHYSNQTNLFYINSTLQSGSATTVSAGTAYFRIGSNAAGGNFFNGSIDEFMIFNRSLSASEVADIYNNQSARFFSSGKLNYSYTLSEGYAKVNVTSYVQNNSQTGINLTVHFYNGTWYNAGTQIVQNGINQTFNISSYSTKLNLSYIFFSDSNNFYTPLLKDNVTFELFDYTDVIPPKLTIESPLIGTYRFSSNDFNISSNENLSFCKFTLDDWLTNYTMTEFNVTFFNYTNSSMLNGSYTAKFWCNASTGNINDTAQISFKVNTTIHTYSNSYYKVNTSSTGGLNFYLADGTLLVSDGLIFQASYTNLTANFSASGLYPEITENSFETKTNFTFLYILDYANVTYVYQFDDNSPFIDLDISVLYKSDIYTNYEYVELNCTLENSKIITADNKFETFNSTKSYFIDEWTEKHIYNENFSLLNFENFQSLDYISVYNDSATSPFSLDSNTLLLCHFNNTYICEDGKTITNSSTEFVTGKWGSGVNVSNNGQLSFKGNSTYINASQGTIDFWFKPDWNSGEINHPYWFNLGSGANRFYFNGYPGGIGVLFVIVDVNSVSHIVYASQNFTKEEWYHLTVTWNTNVSNQCQMAVYVNGKLKSNAPSNRSVCIINQSKWENLNFQVGFYSTSDYATNGTIDEFRVKDTVVPAFLYNASRKLRLTLDNSDNHIHKYYISGYTMDYRNEYLRETGDVANYSLKICVNKSYNILKKERFPNTYKSALSLSNHADYQNISLYNALFYGTSNTSSSDYGTKGFVKNNLRTTMSIFITENGSTIVEGNDYDLDFINFLINIFDAGNEIILHTPTSNIDNRTVVNNSLHNLSFYFGEVRTWIDHSTNMEDIYKQGWNSSNDYYVLDIFDEYNVTYLWSRDINILGLDTQKDSSNDLNMWGSNLFDYSAEKWYPLIWYNNRVDYNKSDNKHLYFWSTISIGSSFLNRYTPQNVDNLINENGLHFGHVYFGFATTSQNTIWENNGEIFEITDAWEANLNYMSQKQEDLELWVDNGFSILDHLIKVRDTQITYPLTGNTYSVKYTKKEGYARFDYADGITLSSENNISSARLDNGNYLIFVRDNKLVLNRLNDNEDVNVTLAYGSYNPNLPKLDKVAPYLDVLKAEYESTNKKVNITINGTGSNKNISLIYNVTSNVYVYDNDYLFATIASGHLASSNSSYSVNYDYSSGVFNFTISSMSRHEIILLEYTPRTTSTTTEQPSSTSTHHPSNSSLEEGYTRSFRKNSKIVVGENILIITDLQEDRATFEIAGEDYTINEDGEIKIDTNTDGYYDLQVSAGTINKVYATLTVQTICEEILSSEKESVSEEIKEIVEENKWIWILIGVAGLLIFGVVGRKVLKKKNI